MEESFAQVVEAVQSLWRALVVQAVSLTRPSRLTQVAVLVAILAISWAASRPARERMRAWMRTLEGSPKWRLRLLVTLNRRIGTLIFAALAWAAVFVTLQFTSWPSRRFLLVLAATLATAWVAIRLAGQLVGNPALRSVVTWALWIWVVLYYLDLTDEVSRVLDSLTITAGEMSISALTVLMAVVVLAILLTAARILSQTVAARIRRNEDISPSFQVLTIKFLQLAVYGFAVLIAIRAIGIDLTGLAVLSGAIGVGLGFGLQKVVSNLVSGVILLLDRSIKPGDVISLGDTFGWINQLGARYVSITTRDGKEYLIPNEDLITGQVVNWSHTNNYVRLDIHFGTSYGDDPHVVRKLAIAAAQSVPRVLTERPAVCHITGFGDSSVDYILRFWITDPTGGLTNIRGNVYLALWDAFLDNGISIPFPQREVRVLGDVPVSQAGDLPQV